MDEPRAEQTDELTGGGREKENKSVKFRIVYQ